MTVAPPSGATYQVGDSLLVLTLAQAGDYGRVVIPTGLARVTDTARDSMSRAWWRSMARSGGASCVLPAEHFTDAGRRRAVAIGGRGAGPLLGGPPGRPSKAAGWSCSSTRAGRTASRAGDIFEVRRTEPASGAIGVLAHEVVATLQIVRVNERTATTRICLNVAQSAYLGHRGSADRQAAFLIPR